MLAPKINHNSWLREMDHPAINLPRWQQQVDLINDLYQSKNTLIIQSNGKDAQIVCSLKQADNGLTTGTMLQREGLIDAICDNVSHGVTQFDATKIGGSFSDFDRLLAVKLNWPDGRLFGCLVICDPKSDRVIATSAAVCDTIKALIQGELKQMYLMGQLQRLSVQDEFTCMLNPYGFNLMAPRQLSLSRRFGSHAGLIVLEEQPSPQLQQKYTESQRIRIIARIISDSMREADISARIENQQFIILAFVDNEANLDSLIARLRKQVHREAPEINLIVGKSFFTPDTQLSLIPMQQEAIADLEKNRG
ncbi:GGDEF domain-containing protein [Shewanella schlegeliana]|uniref:GGDEF domain-containing protein n=1 Tax=Shewanella schlegeliana TaxID=190308 RepID=A0ABS1SVK7_9GAMM|nr:GGDEF domain-containing protein [Shewanella schlegeliana]MBL4912429.1 GGDEF domain-containing protein [Shewanella schlegeliana]MCL1108101.1 GGDEF domain-containing protein [Shewanella schlegeliana]GIU21786.1 GGDEF domain-containing protein [Shewanella schlegeliana]